MDRGRERGMRSNDLGFEILEPRLVMAGVVINEFLAVNTNGVQDLDGDRPDWIELRNTSAAAVDLAGWHLTDDSGDLGKWEIPAINLAPGAYLTIFASGKDRAVAGQELHTNFSLEQNGEYLALVMPDGVTVVQAFDPFPAQVANVSYGAGAGGGGTDSLVGELAPLSFFVPPSSIGTSWQTIGFNDSAWTPATTGIGYDRSATVSYDPLIGFDVEAQMFNLQSTIYLRYEFDLANPSELQSLNLRMIWDDGFVAYLNGQEIKRQQFGAASTPVWNSPSEGSRSDSTCLVPVDFDVTAFLSELQAGPNVLAIHGMNTSLNSNDMLINSRLIAQREVPGQEAYMATPTFGAANTQGTLGVVADTTFSLDRGFYSSPQSVTIATATVGAQIRYTLDGSMPTATTGLIYTPGNPIPINTTTILRAAAFKTGFTPTNVDTQTYVFLDDVIQQDGSGLPAHAPWGHDGPDAGTGFDPDWEMDPNIVNDPTYSGTIKDDLKAVPTVSLVMPWNAWFGGGGEGIYIAGSNLERQGSIEFFSADGSEEFQIDGALEIVGGTSDDRWRNDKLSIRGSFKPPFGPSKLDATVFKDQGATTEFDTLIFDAVFNWSWAYGGTSDLPYQRTQAKYIQDQFVADLQQKMGGAAPHGRFVQLYINGLYWGMYYLHERPDSSFAEAYLGGDKDDYDVIKHNLNVDNIVDGDATAHANYNAMLDAVRANMSVPSNYTTVQQWLDVDDFIDYMLVNYYAGNTDWSHQNWYASFNRVDPNGRWRFHSWDAEHVLRATAPIQPTSDPLQADVTTKNNANSPTEIHNRLIANPEYKLRFADRVQKHFFNGGALTPAATDAVYLARMLEVDRAIVGESARWGDNRDEPGYTRVDWLTTQHNLRSNYFPFRSDIVINQFYARSWMASVAAPSFSQHGGQVLQGYDLTITGRPSGIGVYYTTNGDDPRAFGGGINGTLYSSPVDISAGLTVKARAFDGVNWSALTEATFTVAAPAGPSNLRIVEIHYNPPATLGVGDSQNLEFIELLNPSGQAVSLDGVQITEFDNTPYTFPAGMTLGAGERIVAPKNTTVFQSIYGGSILLAPGGYGLANLSNGGERIALVGPGGEIQSFVYDDADGWPTAADGQGSSLEIIDPMGDASSLLNWRASTQQGGSPGTDGLPPAGTPGDFDGDDDVDGSDFLAWQRGLGITSPNAVRANGDADGDQDVDAADLGLWTTNFGAAVAAAAASVSGAGAEAAAMGSAFLSPGQWIVLSDSNSSKRDARHVVCEEIVDETFEAGYAPDDERGMITASPELPWFNVLLEEDDASALDLALESEVTLGLEENLVAGEF